MWWLGASCVSKWHCINTHVTGHFSVCKLIVFVIKQLAVNPLVTNYFIQKVIVITTEQNPITVILINSASVLTAIFLCEPGLAGFIEAKDDWSGDDSYSCKSCKAPVKSSPPTNQHPVFFTGRMPFLSPNQQCQSTEGNLIPINYFTK